MFTNAQNERASCFALPSMSQRKRFFCLFLICQLRFLNSLIAGNDLSRVLKWGGGYSGGESPVSLLMAIDQAQEVLLDRWCIMFDSPEEVPDTPSNDSAFSSVEEPSIFTMNNYFGIGIGAELCLDFHLQREESPDKFHSRLVTFFFCLLPLKWGPACKC